MNLRVLF